MLVIKSAFDMHQWADNQRQLGKSVGFVPTMGALHVGHERLMEVSSFENDVTVLSIFVNPTQFGEHEDFDKYPRDLEGDLLVAKKCNVDVVFVPSEEEIYPSGFTAWIDPGVLGEVFEGEVRPGHFRGVCTVVHQLFSIVQPTNAYFGQKDAQQFVVLSQLVQNLHLPIVLHRVSTVRETSGLALSSRNKYLSDEDQKRAPNIYQALQMAEAMFNAGETQSRTLIEPVFANLEDFQIDYIAVVDQSAFAPLAKIDTDAYLIVAVRLHGVRLLDNVVLNAIA